MDFYFVSFFKKSHCSNQDHLKKSAAFKLDLHSYTCYRNHWSSYSSYSNFFPKSRLCKSLVEFYERCYWFEYFLLSSLSSRNFLFCLSTSVWMERKSFSKHLCLNLFQPFDLHQYWECRRFYYLMHPLFLLADRFQNNISQHFQIKRNYLRPPLVSSPLLLKLK